MANLEWGSEVDKVEGKYVERNDMEKVVEGNQSQGNEVELGEEVEESHME